MRKLVTVTLVVVLLGLAAATAFAAAPGGQPTSTPTPGETMGPPSPQPTPRAMWRLPYKPCPEKKGYLPARTQTGKCIYYIVRSDGALSLDGKNWMVPGPNH